MSKLSLVLVLPLSVLFLACEDGEPVPPDGGIPVITPGAEEQVPGTGSATATIGEETYEIQITGCAVAAEDDYQIVGEGIGPAERPLILTILQNQREAPEIRLRVGAETATGEPENEFSLGPAAPESSFETLEVQPDEFSLRASGTFVDVASLVQEETAGEIEVMCVPGPGE